MAEAQSFDQLETRDPAQRSWRSSLLPDLPEAKLGAGMGGALKGVDRARSKSREALAKLPVLAVGAACLPGPGVRCSAALPRRRR